MKFKTIFTAVLFSVAGAFMSANAQDDTQNFNNNPVVGEVQGEPVYLQDIMNRKLFDQYQKTLQLIDSEFRIYALEQLAQSQDGIKTLDEFDVSEEEVQQFYDSNNLESRGTIEQMRGQIVNFVGSQKFFGQYASAQEANLVSSYIVMPEEPKLTVAVNERSVRTNPEASVMVLEFSDYQCPYCSRVQSTVKNLMDKYDGQVSFAYKHLPLPFHKEADEAANAVECARDQGKFEEMHNLLFKNPRKQFVENLKQFGKDVGIADIEAYESCIDEGKYNDIVQSDIQLARSLGINGTPGFVIGVYDEKTGELEGNVVAGAVPQQNFEHLIDAYLK